MFRRVKGEQLFLLKNPWSHLRWRGNWSELDTRREQIFAKSLILVYGLYTYCIIITQFERDNHGMAKDKSETLLGTCYRAILKFNWQFAGLLYFV